LPVRFPVFWLGALILSAGCGSAPAAPSPSPPSPIRVTVEPTQTLVGTPDTATFTLRAENVGTKPAALTFPSSCQLVPYFTDRTGQPVAPRGGGFACAAVIVYRPLQAGESFSQVFTVKTGEAPLAQFIVLPAGDYQIYARLEDSSYRLQSEPLAFSLR
jgi:hypothetical protein